MYGTERKDMAVVQEGHLITLDLTLNNGLMFKPYVWFVLFKIKSPNYPKSIAKQLIFFTCPYLKTFKILHQLSLMKITLKHMDKKTKNSRKKFFICIFASLDGDFQF